MHFNTIIRPLVGADLSALGAFSNHLDEKAFSHSQWNPIDQTALF